MPTKPPGTPDVDLTFNDTFGTINGAVFMTGLYQLVPDQFSSFLEVRHNGVEQGYNTDGALQQNQLDGHNSTHSILLAEVPIVIGDGSHGTQDGVAYREFRLTLDEAGSAKQYLSLDSFQIWQEESGSLANFTPGSGFTGSHTNYLAYDLDAGADRWIGLKEGLNGNGANITEFTILIPDSAFINDPAHRYITLYSKFGMQAGWEADSSSEEWGLSHASGGPVSAMTVHKTATVPGGTANVAGEVISYDITVANVGNTNLTGLTVTDTSASNLAGVLSGGFNIGDTNHDNQLSVGETWQYTANHTVTQDDINTNGGGDGSIENTVTADTNETTPVSASASVAVEQGSAVHLEKTASVASVDSAGDVINYTINVTNTGNVALTGVNVSDSQINIVTPILDFNAPVLGPPLIAPVIVGDYNAGDTNQNGVEDLGETFQFQIVGDDNNNGIEDPGETFVRTNVGDTNQNGSPELGEVFQFYNAGDTNHNGVEDSGETFQFTVSHAATPVDADHDGFNDGDTNHDGALDLTETWQYTVSYTVTQSDIDNGGVVNPSLTHDNTASVTTALGVSDSDSVSVSVLQDPRVAVTKSAVVADGSANAAGDVINYTITVHNAGNMTLTGVTVSDPSVSSLNYLSGDTDGDNKLDLTETWTYTASHTVTQAEIDNGGVVDPMLTYDNTASVTTDQGTAAPNPDPDANASASASVPIVQNPHLTLVKSASVADGTANAAGDVINYTINVTNDGNMTLTHLGVSDPSVSGLAPVLSGGFNAGDTDHDGKVDLGETWQYTASHTVTQADIDNGGVVNPLLTYSNTASATTDQGASDSDTAAVPIVQSPQVTLDKTATVPGGTADTAGEVISYTIDVANAGNMTLTGVTVSDPSVADLAAVMSGGFNSGDTNQDGNLNLGETWHYTASHTVTQGELDTNGGGDGTIDNTASVSTAQGASANDSTHVTVVPTPVAPLTIDDNFNLSMLVDVGPAGPDAGGDLIQFFFQVTNHTSGTFTSVTVTDTQGDAVPGSLQTPIPSSIGPLAGFNDTFNHFLTATDISNGFVDDDVTVSGLDPSSMTQMATLHFHFLL
ncbi:MAG: DUF11 domain-containing protein [Alphaproteobacteria bacterium]|nr:MAG: DUF11 domain-containing protein [Alphaproteobacteria bacterium]